MPYPEERASYEPLRRLSDSERVRKLLGQYHVREFNPSPAVTLKYVTHADLPSRAWRPSWVLAVDGSYLPVSIRNGFPGAEAAYITVASLMIDAGKIRELDAHRPVEPGVFRKTKFPDAIDDLLPGCNFVHEDDKSAKESFRRALHGLMAEKRMAEDGESLLDTYHALLQYKPQNQKPQACPYDDCEQDVPYRPQAGVYKCACSDARRLYSTDALRIHERMNPESGSNDKIYAEVMQMLERVWIVHILRTLEQKRWLSSLKHLAVMVDGPLAVFGQPAWISGAISHELRRINQAARAINGEDILMLGIEKGGDFALHFEQLDETVTGGKGSFPTGTAALLDDAYIKQNIYFSESLKLYGEGTYFGRKFFYKTKTGARIIASVPYLHDEDSDWRLAIPSQFPRLNDALTLLDELISSRFPNALEPIVAAHAEASIPLNIGTKVLENLARKLSAGN